MYCPVRPSVMKPEISETRVDGVQKVQRMLDKPQGLNAPGTNISPPFPFP